MKINKLSDKEFHKTFSPPMQELGFDDETSGINLKKYIQKIIKKEKLKTSTKDIEIHYVYHSPNEKYEHILFNYGVNELYLVIVINLINKDIIGYHILDLLEKYGIE